MASSHLIPAAIVLAGGLIGTGLYFGLAAREPVQPASETASAAPSTPTPPLPSHAPPPAVTSQPDDEVKRVTAAAEAALAALEPKLRKTCWDPAVGEKPEPSRARWTWDVTFDTRGVEIARGISDVRGLERPDVAECLRRQPLDLRVPPPSKNTRVTLQLELP